MPRRLCLIAVGAAACAVASLLMALAGGANATHATRAASSLAPTSTVVVALREGVDAARVQARHEGIAAIGAVRAGGITRLVGLEPGVDTDDRIAELAADPDVLYAEPLIEYRSFGLTPTDTLFPAQWALEAIRAAEAWTDTQGSSSIKVAVIDTGLDATRPDLVGQVAAGGYDYVNKDTDPTDDNGHGTHVSGIIAGASNGSGIVGVAPGVKILPLKVLDSSGSGFSADIADAIRFATDSGARVINLSLGATVRSEAIADSVAYAVSRGVVVVAAAGNFGENGNPTCYPAAEEGVVAVASLDRVQQPDGGPIYSRSAFSEYGAYVDVAAPGGRILSTIIPSRVASGFAEMSGTSMAAPHVAGAAALCLSSRPSLSASQVTRLLETSAIDLGAEGRDDLYGAGLVDTLGLLEAAKNPVIVTSSSPASDPGWTNTRDVGVALVSPGATSYRIAEGSISVAAWRAITATTTFTLSSGNGTKTINVQYRTSSMPVTTRMQEGDAAISLSPFSSWIRVTGPGYSDGAERYASAAGATAVVNFRGSTIRWIGERLRKGGYARVTLDGVPKGTVDTYASVVATAQTLFEESGLSAGDHTLVVEVLGLRNPLATGYQVPVDAFEAVDDTVSDVAQASIVLDTAAPGAALIESPADGAEATIYGLVVRGRGEPDARVELTDGVNAAISSAGSDGSFACGFVTSFGQKDLAARSIDAAGNVGAWSAETAINVVASGDSQWQEYGPGPFEVYQVATASKVDAPVYALTGPGNMWIKYEDHFTLMRSEDQGATWDPLPFTFGRWDDEPTPPNYTKPPWDMPQICAASDDPTSLAIVKTELLDPTDGTSHVERVYLSTDSGMTWQNVGGPGLERDVSQIASAGAGRYFVSTYQSAIYESRFDPTVLTELWLVGPGDTWTPVTMPIDTTNRVRMTEGSAAGQIYMWIPGTGLYFSGNANGAGTTWTQRADGSGLPEATQSLCINPADPSELLACNPGGVVRSDDFGASWSSVLTMPASTAVQPQTGAQFSADGSVALVSSNGSGAFRSADAGRDIWTEVTPAGERVQRSTANVAASPNTPVNLVAVKPNGFTVLAGQALARSADGSTDWLTGSGRSVLKNTTQFCLLGDGADASMLAETGEGLYRLDRVSGQWLRSCNYWAGPRKITRLVRDPFLAGHLMAATVGGGGFWQSSDDGHTWSGGGDNPVGWVEYSPLVDGLAMKVEDTRGVTVTRDHGTTWEPAYKPTPRFRATGMAYDPFDADVAFITGHDRWTVAGTIDYRLLKTSDAGRTWTNVGSGTGIRYIQADPVTAGRLFGLRSPGYEPVVSTDGGATWSEPGPWTVPQSAFSTNSALLLRPAPEGETALYVIRPDSVVRSSDSGRTWSSLGFASGSSLAARKAIAAELDGDMLYVAFTDIFRLADDFTCGTPLASFAQTTAGVRATVSSVSAAAGASLYSDGVHVGAVPAGWAGGNLDLRLPDGIHVLSARAVDFAGNVSDESARVSITVDSSPPLTTATISPAPGAYGWSRGSAAVALTARDDLAGVATVRYRLDGASSFINYTGPVPLPEGDHTLWLSSIDSKGNAEPPRAFSARTDSIPPAGAVLSPMSGSVIAAPTQVVGLASDDHLLGWRVGASREGEEPVTIASAEGEGCGQPLAMFDPSAFASGAWTVWLRVEDLAGNVTTHSVVVQSVNPSANRTLTYSAGAGGTILGATAQVVPFGGTGSAVTALPNAGYHFVSWSDAATSAVRTDAGVVEDTSFTALFARNPLPKATVYTPHAPSTMYRGRSYSIYGYVKPRHSSGTYLVQLNFYLRNSRGVYAYHSHVHARRYYYSSTMTRYKASVSLPHRGRWRVRAYHSDAGHSPSYSGFDYITVK